MRLVIQRVSNAAVTVGGVEVSSIGEGLMILVGVEKGDMPDAAVHLAEKCAALRIFNDEAGVMNRSVTDTGGEVLAVSQFTLLGSTRKGNRPSYVRAAGRPEAEPLYDLFCSTLSGILGRDVKKGIFGADMQVALVNSGPVTIVIDTNTQL